jgi:hypothetical protein
MKKRESSTLLGLEYGLRMLDFPEFQFHSYATNAPMPLVLRYALVMPSP